MAMPPLSSVMAGGRNAASFTAGVTFGVAVTLAAVGTSLEASDIDAVATSINRLSTALVALVAAVVPVYTIFRSWRSASPENQQAAVALAKDKLVIEVEPDHKTEAALDVASLSRVKSVITTQAIAAATPMVEKIVGPDAKPVVPVVVAETQH